MLTDGASDGVIELVVVDTSRPTPAIGPNPGALERTLPIVVYLPATTDAAPLVVLAHGFDGHPRKFSELASFWAAAGYVVVVPCFPVSNDEFEVRDTEFREARLGDVAEQAVDVGVVVNELLRSNGDPASDLHRRIDPERIGLFGLSLGSVTAWIAVLDGEAATAARFKALIQSDGAFPGADERLGNVTIPVLVAHSDADPIFDPELVMHQFGALPSPKQMLVLHGASHATVGENTPTAADQAYRNATTVFWDRYLKGCLDQPFPAAIVIDGVTSFIDRS